MKQNLSTKVLVSLIACLSVVIAIPTADDEIAISKAADRTIQRDVVVVGGGATGSYAAFRLQQDYGKSVLLIEKTGHLGGQVSSYVSPTTNFTVNYGVQSYNDYGPARAFFEKLKMPLGSMLRVNRMARYVDYSTGEVVTDYVPPTNADRIAAMERYSTLCSLYDSILLPSFSKFPAPADIPEDLLLPFGAFVAKHNLSAAVPQIFSGSGLGLQDISKQLTIWVIQAYGSPMVQGILGKLPFIAPASHRNGEIYERVSNALGAENVMLSSIVVDSVRKNDTITLLVSSPNNTTTAVVTKRLIIAYGPTTTGLAPFHPDSEEQNVFDQFIYQTVHVGIVSHPSLPINGSFVTIEKAAAPNNYLTLPQGRFLGNLDGTGLPTNEYVVVLAGDEHFDIPAAKKLVTNAVANLIKAGTIPASTAPVEFKAWDPHPLMHAHASLESLKSGFIQRLNAIEGHRKTWYVSCAVTAQYSAIGWANVDLLLPEIVAGM